MKYSTQKRRAATQNYFSPFTMPLKFLFYACRVEKAIPKVEGLDLEGLVEIPLPASGAEIEAGVDIKVPCKGLLARIGRA
jgi:hypothetical protein